MVNLTPPLMLIGEASSWETFAPSSYADGKQSVRLTKQGPKETGAGSRKKEKPNGSLQECQWLKTVVAVEGFEPPARGL